MRVRYIGVGEAVDESLPNTSLLVETPNGNILLDCGFSAVQQLWRRVPDKDHVDLVYLTHEHADHTFGLPALLIRMLVDGRKKPLLICGHTALVPKLERLLESGYPTLRKEFSFPLEFRGFDRELTWKDCVLRIAPTTHSVPNYAVRIESQGKAMCFSGDGMFTSESQALYRRSSLLVHEAFTRDAPKWGHASISSVRELADRLRPGKVDLVHLERFTRRERAENDAAVKGWASIPETDTVRDV